MFLRAIGVTTAAAPTRQSRPRANNPGRRLSKTRESRETRHA